MFVFSYETSDWGWSAETKREEMFHESASYIIARDADSNVPCAFAVFRFDMDFDDVVMYWYESIEFVQIKCYWLVSNKLELCSSTQLRNSTREGSSS